MVSAFIMKSLLYAQGQSMPSGVSSVVQAGFVMGRNVLSEKSSV